MDRARIEEELERRYPRSEEYKDRFTLARMIEFAQHIAAIARNEALEEAIKVCELDNDSDHLHQNDCAEAIRALKESK